VTVKGINGMKEQHISRLPERLASIHHESHGFKMASDPMTGSLLRTFAASKPSGNLLELGTGTGIGTAWLLDGMDENARLVTIDNDPNVADVARRHLSDDRRVRFRLEDAAEWILTQREISFDLIFADAWVGKYSYLDDALRLLKLGGLYVIDDMLPQPNWPEGHAENVARLVAALESRRNLAVTKLNWSTGIVIAAAIEE
jgi:predicted O-methyltransferase YrrM